MIEIFEPHDLKLRPIVGSPKCPPRKLIQWIDILLKPLLKHIKSFICDSLNFLNKYPRDVDEDTEINTFDLISLYISICHKFGLEAIYYFLTKYQEDLHPRFRKEFVLESANFIPTYANLTMGYHEIKVYSITHQTYALASKHFENFWFRYLDDCQILMKVNLIKPEHSLSILNLNYWSLLVFEKDFLHYN